MKFPLPLLTAGLLTGLTSLPALAAPANGNGNGNAHGHGDPYIPMGSLDVSSKMVRTGAKTELTWEITYPTTTEDLVEIGPTGTVTALEEVRVQVRVAGVAFQSGSTELPVAFWTRVTGGSWNQDFYGRGSDVQPDQIVLDRIISPGQSLDFAGRARKSNGRWYDVRWTASNDSAVIGLVNGDAVPDYAPAYQQGEIEDFLSAYVGRPGNGNSNGNNGHGNNIDGVDVSNPGKGKGGPNGSVDPSGNVDDERGSSNGSSSSGSNQLVATIGPRDLIFLFELASRNPGDWWFDMQDLVVIATFEATSRTVTTP